MRGLINLLIVFLTTIGFGQVSDFSTWASYVPEKKKREITEVERGEEKSQRIEAKKLQAGHRTFYD